MARPDTQATSDERFGHARSGTVPEDPSLNELDLACVAHELRGPLVAAAAAIDASIRGGQAGRHDLELLRGSRRELEGLLELVDSLLRWTAHPGPARTAPMDLGRVAQEAVASCSLQWPDAVISVMAPARCMVLGDEPQLHAAVSNLIRNAVEHSPAGRRVHVTVDRRGERVGVSVSDRGPGVGPAEQHAIFEPLARGRNASTSATSRGLGLFIAKRVVEAHGGTIGLHSTGSGATFRIELAALERPHSPRRAHVRTRSHRRRP